MLDAAGILTARGGMTSHAAVVARGMGGEVILISMDFAGERMIIISGYLHVKMFEKTVTGFNKCFSDK